jgi:hypothetical protein
MVLSDTKQETAVLAAQGGRAGEKIFFSARWDVPVGPRVGDARGPSGLLPKHLSDSVSRAAASGGSCGPGACLY